MTRSMNKRMTGTAEVPLSELTLNNASLLNASMGVANRLTCAPPAMEISRP